MNALVVAYSLLVGLSPALLLLAAVRLPRAVRRLAEARRARCHPLPGGPPIERIAADLRRLLWQHHLVSRSPERRRHARRVWALEYAITNRALQAARALEVPHPDVPSWGGYDRAQLRGLLRALAAEGLVLPRAVDLLTPDSHS